MKTKVAILTAGITVVLCICVIAVIIGNKDKNHDIIVLDSQSVEQSIVSIEESKELIPNLELDVEDESEDNRNSETDMVEETVTGSINPTTESSVETAIESSAEQIPEISSALSSETTTESKPEETSKQAESSEEGIALPEVDF